MGDDLEDAVAQAHSALRAAQGAVRLATHALALAERRSGLERRRGRPRGGRRIDDPIDNLATHLALMARFKADGGVNYVDYHLQAASDELHIGEFVLTVRHRDGKTAHELRREVEAERDALRESAREVAELNQPNLQTIMDQAIRIQELQAALREARTALEDIIEADVARQHGAAVSVVDIAATALAALPREEPTR